MNSIPNINSRVPVVAQNVIYNNTTSGLQATNVQDAIDEVAQGSGGTGITKIWDNPDSSQSFIAQPITLTSADYDLLLWVFGAGSAASPKSVIVPKGSNVLLEAGLTNSTVGTTNIQRAGTYVSDTSYNVGDGSLGRPGSAASTDNTVCKPLTIYGIKF